jgi:hypothetical protein
MTTVQTKLTDNDQLVRALRGPQFNRKHGSLYDRGSADSYYGRVPDPHYWPEGTGHGIKVSALNEVEIAEYYEGYDDNERSGDKKSYS